MGFCSRAALVLGAWPRVSRHGRGAYSIAQSLPKTNQRSDVV
jgi:hypothetical protein